MNLESYLRASSGWLVDATTTFDLALAGEIACQHSWRPPDNSKLSEGPHFVSMSDASAFDRALPLAIRSSRVAMMAAWVACGDAPERASNGGVKVPFTDDRSPRVEAVLARAGIIAQFELWKAYVSQFPDYPTNLKAARIYRFSNEQEEKLVNGLIDLRNRMTHEVDIKNDPSARRLVDYTWECQHMAEWVTRLYHHKAKGLPATFAD